MPKIISWWKFDKVMPKTILTIFETRCTLWLKKQYTKLCR